MAPHWQRPGRLSPRARQAVWFEAFGRPVGSTVRCGGFDPPVLTGPETLEFIPSRRSFRALGLEPARRYPRPTRYPAAEAAYRRRMGLLSPIVLFPGRRPTIPGAWMC